MKLFDCHIVCKSWGKEIWINDPESSDNKRYAYKRIYIDAHKQCSLQKHEFKSETNYIISGRARVTLENDVGVLQEYEMGPNEFFSVPVGRVHRVYALTDLVLQECSTPEVQDCIRLKDDYNRPSGKIEAEHQKPVVLLLAAGKGERVAKISKNLHKGLLKIGKRAAISVIIDKFPKECELVVALGYNGKLLKDYLTAAHPERKISFVDVPVWEGEGSGPATSALACKENLARPFYFCTIDCIFADTQLPLFSTDNWIGTSPTDIPELYSTAQVDNHGNVTSFKNKSKEGYNNAFIGLAYVYSHENFWRALEGEREIVSVFEKNFAPLKTKEIVWDDIGNIDGYNRLVGKSQTLAKTTEEESYQIGGQFVKVNSNREITNNRVGRAKFLPATLTPKITSIQDYCFAYEFEPGQTLYELDDIKIYKKFIDLYFDETITPDTAFAYTEAQIKMLARRFYYTKTVDRSADFIKDHLYMTGPLVVNGETVSFIGLDDLDWDELCAAEMTKHWHGDLQPDNILYTDKGEFRWLDWRPDWSGQMDGDIYYDLAKLYAGLSFSYLAAKDTNIFEYNRVGNEFFYKIPQTENMKRARQYLEEQIKANDFNIDKVKALSSIIWMNMSPLHLSPFSEILYLESIRSLQN